MLSNADVAELLSRESENATGHVRQALKRAAGAAFLWPDEVVDLLAAGRPLTQLAAIGPFLAQLIQGWVDSPPAALEPPELRRDFLTLTQARKALAAEPQWRSSLRGDLQMHTVWSDGSGTVRQMADSARERGYEFIGITDHTKGLKIAGGLDEERLAAQGREIAHVNEVLGNDGAGLTVLRSAEVNLSVTGEVDMEAAALAELDLVLGSFHSALRKTDDQTARYLAAVRNPHVQILGHPQCRVYDYRLGLKPDWERVFAEAARLDKAIEIDGYPDRQDLRLSLLQLARKSGVRISFGTDAHHPWQLGFIELSLGAACLAKISPERIVNFLPLPQLRSWVARLRQS